MWGPRGPVAPRDPAPPGLRARLRELAIGGRRTVGMSDPGSATPDSFRRGEIFFSRGTTMRRMARLMIAPGRRIAPQTGPSGPHVGLDTNPTCSPKGQRNRLDIGLINSPRSTGPRPPRDKRKVKGRFLSKPWTRWFDPLRGPRRLLLHQPIPRRPNR